MFGTLKIEDGLARLGEYLSRPVFWLSLLIVVVAVILWQLFKHARKKWKERHGGMTTASHVAFDIARFVFWFVLIIVLMQINGVNVTALITGLGVISVIIGLALQDFLKDVIMGVHILTDKFFQVGDIVRYNDKEGEVISFNVRATKIKMLPYGEVITVSNRNISEIIVLADMFDLDVNLPYFVEAKKIHETMEIISEKIGKIDGITKSLYKGTESFNDSSATYKLRYWTHPGETRFDIRRAAVTIVQEELAKANIPFPYNHVDVDLFEKKS